MVEDYLRSISIPQEPRLLYDPVRYTLNGEAKRLRPRLVLLGCGLCGGQPSEALPAAASVELLHNFTLIHDDIMDRAESRRGRPSVYKKWDESTAILSGDVLFSIAIQQLLAYGRREGYSREHYEAIQSCFMDAVDRVCEGQARDLDFESREQVTIDEYYGMIEAKTAALIRASLQLGALVADVDRETVERIGRLGRHAGMAFQIQDDVLDAVGDAEKFGKKTGGDIREGKKTCLSILALQQMHQGDRQEVSRTIHSGQAGDEAVHRVIELYKRYGIIDQVKKTANTHYSNALNALDSFEDSVYRNEIKALLNQLMEREW